MPFDLDGAWSFVSSAFESAAGWAWDTVVTGIADWVVKAVVGLVLLIWQVISKTTSPHLDAEWFSGRQGSPWWMAVQIGFPVTILLLMLAIARSVLAGSPGMAVKATFRDLPLAVLGMVSLLSVVQAGLDLTDAISDWIWAQTADTANAHLDGLATVLMRIPGGVGSFLGVALAIVLMLSMAFTWVVLIVRGSMIYITVVYAAAFGLPSLVFEGLRDTTKQIGHMLLALILAKPAIVLAIAIGVNALSGVGATGEPGEGTVDNALAEMGTLVVGIVTFLLASFMPFVVYKLLPVVAAAAVAQGVAAGPMRAVQQGMSMSYYSGRVLDRLSSSATPEQTSPTSKSASESSSGSDRMTSTSPPSPTSGSGGPGATTGAAGGVSAGATSGGAAAGVAGPAAAVAIPVAAAAAAVGAVKETAQSTATAISGAANGAANGPAGGGPAKAGSENSSTSGPAKPGTDAATGKVGP